MAADPYEKSVLDYGHIKFGKTYGRYKDERTREYQTSPSPKGKLMWQVSFSTEEKVEDSLIFDTSADAEVFAAWISSNGGNWVEVSELVIQE